jgi:hypothetical protein
MKTEQDNNASNEIVKDSMEFGQESKIEETVAAKSETEEQVDPSQPRAETYEEREARLDAEERIVKRNCIIFGVLPLFIGFWVFCYYFFQYLEEHKISSSIPSSSFYCENQINHFDIS